MQRNFLMIFSGRKQTQEASEKQQKSHRGPTSHLGMPVPPRRALVPRGPPVAHLCVIRTLKNHIYSETPES